LLFAKIFYLLLIAGSHYKYEKIAGDTPTTSSKFHASYLLAPSPEFNLDRKEVTMKKKRTTLRTLNSSGAIENISVRDEYY